MRISILFYLIMLISSCSKKNEVIITTDKTEIKSRDSILFTATTNFKVKSYEWKLDGYILPSTKKDVKILFYTKGKHIVELTTYGILGKNIITKMEYNVKPSMGKIKRWFDHSPLYSIKYFYKLALSAKGFTDEGVAYYDSIYLDSMPGNSDYEIFCDKVKFPCIQLDLPGGKYLCKFYGEDESGGSNYYKEMELEIDGDCQSMNH